MQVESFEDVDVVGPEADSGSFEDISDDESHNISLLLEGVSISVGNFIFDIFYDSNDIYHVALAPYLFVLPLKILVLVLRFNGLIGNLMNFVLLLFQSNVLLAFHFLALK